VDGFEDENRSHWLNQRGVNMEFSASSIILAIFTGLISGLASYFGAYTKVKAELRAATEDLEQTIQNLVRVTRAAELEKAKIASDSAIALDQRRTLYALVSATQSMTHSIPTGNSPGDGRRV
jgi:hypothetical protein